MSELRQDLVSGDWVIIAPGRAARPKFLDVKKPARKPAPKATCPFEWPALKASGQWTPIFQYPAKTGSPELAVLPNKFPIVSHVAACSENFRHGLYAAKTGVGFHELVIARDHTKNFADLDLGMAARILEVMQDRYREALADGCSKYVVPFFNWGPAAGASVWHPHYQVMSLPEVPTHTAATLKNEAQYFAKHHRCIRCDIIVAERKEKTRVVAENKEAIAITPYASKVPFEMMILPRRHNPSFHDASPAIIRGVANILQSAMQRLRQRANDPDLNFFIHDVPVDRKQYPHHHWHIELLPRASTPAGFEFSTGMYVDQVEPEKAAAILRGS